MTGVPVYCPNCGAIFASRMFDISNSRGIRLSDCHEPCVQCGKDANLVEGVFDVTNNAVTLIRGSELTANILRAFSQLLEETQSNKITPDELQTKAAKLHPKLEEAIASARKTPGLLWIVITLLLAVLHQCHFNIDATIDLNKLFEQITSQ